MVEQSGTGRAGTVFSAYVVELQEFLASRGVQFGAPAHLAPFAELVSVPGPFQEEMESMVRSIHFREADTLGRADLLDLLTVAVGGPDLELSRQAPPGQVRKIFMFVNESLRARQWTFPTDAEDPGEMPVTAGQILAAEAAEGSGEERALGVKVSQNGSYREEEPVPAPGARPPQADQPASQGSGILFKAVSMSEEESAFPVYGSSQVPITRRPWFLPAAIAAVVAIGVGVYAGRPSGNHAAGAAGATVAPVQQTQSRPLTADACVAPSTAGPGRARLQDRSRWAHGLLDQKLYEAALPELKAIAQADPSFPGINLDQSDALLQMKRPEDAREAVDAQIGISDCLNNLPSAALDSYCSAEFTPSTLGGCRAQLAHIRQAAELQAALVHLELGHRAAPEGSAPDPALTEALRPEAAPVATPIATPVAPSHASTAAPRGSAAMAEAPRTPHAKRPVPLPPASEGDNAEAAPLRSTVAASKPATAKPDRKPSSDDALRRGEGTDSAYGAYSKPQ